jgi:hypothetical protein
VWEKAHLKQRVGEFLPNGPNWGNIPKSNMLVGFFLPYEKNNPIEFFSPVGFFMEQLIGVKTPPKSHGVLCFEVRYLKNYNQ